MKALLGIDWGGTYIKAGVLNQQGKVIKKTIYNSKELRKKNIFIASLERLLTNEFRRFDIQGMGIGAPGIINVETGFVYYLPNIPGWKNYPLKTVLQKRLKIPVFVNNDANAFALAESTYGAAKGKQRSICLTLGTGLGGAVVFEGQLLKTAVSAHELGHVPISLSGKKCNCGGQGCIETFVGSRHLIRRYRQLTKKKSEKFEVKDIFQRARRGELKALAVWQEFSLALGKFLAGMINIFNPQVIVFGGGISGAFSLFKPMVAKVIKKQAMWPHLKEVKLVRASLGDAGIIGAALLARQNCA